MERWIVALALLGWLVATVSLVAAALVWVHKGRLARRAAVRARTAQERARRAEVFMRFVEIANLGTKEADLLAASGASLGEIFPGRPAAVYLAQGPDARLTRAASSGPAVTPGATLPLEFPRQCPAIAGNRTLRLDGRKGGPSCPCPHDGNGEPPADRLCAPLTTPHRPLGVVQLQAIDGQSLTRDEAAELTRFANRLAAALANTRLLAIVQHQALTDEMTGLYNYRFLQDYLSRILAPGRRREAPLSLLMLDVDQFKQINDRHGHRTGDAALRRLAETLRDTVRAEDLVARYAGDEFAVILPETPAVDARVVAERVRAAVERLRLSLSDQPPLRLTVSVGLAATPGYRGHWQALVQAADASLYQAKRRGGNQVVEAGSEPTSADSDVAEVSAGA